MAEVDLVDRLAMLPTLAEMPREELEWLAAHGEFERYEPGVVVAPKGERIEKLWIILSGNIGVRIDRGTGERWVMGWGAGEVTGRLPYSRMTITSTHNLVEEAAEVLSVHEKDHPEMIRRCPQFTAYNVHLMLDRARSFNSSDLHDEKMISLGKLAAGLAHELNNPASATARGAKLLLGGLDDAEAASRALGATGLGEEFFDTIDRIRTTCMTQPVAGVLSPIQQADREDTIAAWLTNHQADAALADPLAATAITIDALETIAKATSDDTLDPVLRWIATGCATRSLAVDIEQAAGRIHELVAAVRRFTYMDNLSGPESVDVESGLRDTIRVVASKARARGAGITLDIPPDLPRVHATGGELNQVWLNLIDNALDAIAESGQIDIIAKKEVDRVVVSIVDNGPGIPPDVLPQIFDPFFTTKPPGQGTGLGLQIVRQLVRRHQGDVTAESQPGRTVFNVSLSVTEPAVAEG